MLCASRGGLQRFALAGARRDVAVAGPRAFPQEPRSCAQADPPPPRTPVDEGFERRSGAKVLERSVYLVTSGAVRACAAAAADVSVLRALTLTPFHLVSIPALSRSADRGQHKRVGSPERAEGL